MSDETPDKSAAPGSTASDGSPSSAVPRLSKPHEGSTPQPPKATAGATLKNLAANPGAAAPEAKAAEAKNDRQTKPVVKTQPGKPGSAKPAVDGVTPVARPTTAGEYARTTKSSPSSTAVIPVIKDEPASPAQSAASAGRQASLKLVRVDPWSVTKVVFALTVAMMIVAVVAVTILWIVLSFAGVWDQINSSVTTVLSDESSTFDITEYLGFGRIVGLTLVISAINVVITTAVATIGAYLYNLAAQLLGGVDVTLAEEN